MGLHREADPTHEIIKNRGRAALPNGYFWVHRLAFRRSIPVLKWRPHAEI
jgi:hypothetical protein